MNLSSSMIALSILSGNSAGVMSGGGADSAAPLPIEGPKARAAKKAFTTVKAPAPWEKQGFKPADAAQLASVRAMKSIIDSSAADKLPGDPDLHAAFIAYRAIDRLQVLAQAAAKPSLSALDRDQLQRSFERGLAQLRNFIGTAKTDKLTLYYGQAGSSVQSFALSNPSFIASGVGDVIAHDARAGLTGLTGSEVFELKIGARGAEPETLRLDLSSLPNPPSLTDVVNKLNDVIAASPKKWSTRFEVKQVADKKYAIGYRLGAGEAASLDEAGAGDALMVAVAHRGTTGNDSLALHRYGEPGADLSSSKLVGTDVSADRKATALAAAEIEAKAKKKGDGYVKADPTVNAGLTVHASANDADGNSYLVGTAAGDYGALQSSGGRSLFVSKVDSAGHILWRRALGAASDVDGAAVSVDAKGNVSVAGSVAEKAGSLGVAGVDADMVVARFSSSGEQLFRTTVSNPGRDVARAIATDGDGNVVVGGVGTNGSGVKSGLVMKIDANGRKIQRVHPDGVDDVDAIGADSDGHIVLLTRDGDGSAVHRYDSALSSEVAHYSLGSGVQATALALADDGRVAVVGGTDIAVAGSAANARSGGHDAFVTVLARDLSGARTSYIGSADDESADSVAFSGGEVYVGGRTYGSLNGARRGKEDGFVARVALSDGSVGAIDQFGTPGDMVGSVQVDVVHGGSNHLGLLGLASGELAPKPDGSIVGQTGIVPAPKGTEGWPQGGLPGDKFRLQVDDGSIKTIAIDANETLTSLRDKIRKVLGKAAMVSLPSAGADLASLKINVLQGHKITLLPGKITDLGGDALTKLGLTPGTYSAPAKTDLKVTPGGRFGLNLEDVLSLGTKDSATRAVEELSAAANVIKGAYGSLFWTATKAEMADGRNKGSSAGSAADQAKLASYKDALARLSAGAGSSSSLALL